MRDEAVVRIGLVDGEGFGEALLQDEEAVVVFFGALLPVEEAVFFGVWLLVEDTRYELGGAERGRYFYGREIFFGFSVNVVEDMVCGMFGCVADLRVGLLFGGVVEFYVGFLFGFVADRRVGLLFGCVVEVYV